MVSNNKITDQANEKQYYPYLISDWEGYNLGIEGDEEIRRKYFKGDLSVGLMVVPSKGDRKNIHTPEYCQYGKGWEVDERNSVKFMTENGNLCVTKLELEKMILADNLCTGFNVMKLVARLTVNL